MLPIDARAITIATVAALLTLAVGAYVVVGSWDDDPATPPSDAQRDPAIPSPYIDDRSPGAQTAPNEIHPSGYVEDPPVKGNAADHAEEVVRDFQESLATAAGTACWELADAVVARLAGDDGCAATIERVSERRAAAGDPYRPSKILAVDVRGNRAYVVVQHGDRRPFTVVLRPDAAGGLALFDIDLTSPSGLRPSRSSQRRR